MVYMSERVPIISGMLYLDLESICHDGRSIPDCGRGGVKGLCYHGTKDLFAFLNSNGIFTDATNMIKDYEGWCHSTTFATARQYAGPHRIGSYSYQIVLAIDNHCQNSCGRGRRWKYTRSGCLRYHLVGAYVIPIGGRSLAAAEMSRFGSMSPVRYAFSLGGGCFVAKAMTQRACRAMAGPFDYMVAPPALVAACFADGFEEFLDQETFSNNRAA